MVRALSIAIVICVASVGAVEEHGPHLAVGADTFQVLAEVDRISRRVGHNLSAWTVVIMPPINYGNRGANDIGDRRTHPGTYSIRQSTLQSLVADVGAEVARNEFKWIAVLNGHGGPSHNLAINEACDFVSDTFNVTMIHVTALFRADAAIQAQGKKMNAAHFSAAYLSSPARATAAYGRAVETWWVDGCSDLILRAARGEDLRARPRSPEQIPAGVAPMVGKTLEEERAFGTKLEDWLAQRRK
jgi:creatinine amidohydrolase